MTLLAGAGAVCRSPVAPLRASPDHAAEQTSQLLLGETVRLEERSADGAWWRVTAERDGDRGWLRAWHASPGAEAWATRLAAEGAWVAVRHAEVRAGTGRADPVVAPLPWGARVVAVGEEGAWTRVLLPGGAAGVLPRRALVRVAAGPPGGPPSAARLGRTARALLGIPYLWGGRSAWGYDCSGLVQAVLGWHGIRLPRDAAEQWAGSRSGRAPVRRAEALAGGAAARLAAGWLLFFSGPEDEVTHVGLSVGRGMLLHARGEVRLDALEGIEEAIASWGDTRIAGAAKPTPEGR